jgi:phytoene dehydrogenase-like protein
MAEAACAAGAEIRTGVAVEQVVINKGRVSAVVTGGQELATDLVISTLDPGRRCSRWSIDTHCRPISSSAWNTTVPGERWPR